MLDTNLLKTLVEHGFGKVERDDRLLDIFTAETSEKGVELWDRWNKENVNIVKIRLPYKESTVQMFAISRPQLEKALAQNETLDLSGDFLPEATGLTNITFS